MAGYNNEREVERYSRTVAEHYGERFIESGYKPLREFTTVVDGAAVNKPLIQYTLEALFANEEIGEIVIVGHQALLEQRLGGLIRRHEKPCRILNQNALLGDETVRTFNILPRKVKRGSVAWNLVKGYAATAACRERRHALFVASDSPFTTNTFIDRFLRIVERYEGEADIISPAVVIDGKRDRLGRLPLRLRNDSAFRVPGAEDEYGRQGFRLSSLLSANLHRFDINTANTAYDLRKALNPNVQLRLFKITRQLGYQNVYSKYFLRRDLSITEVEDIVSAFFRGRVKVVPMEGMETTYDYDGTDHEYQMISHLLKPGVAETEAGENGDAGTTPARSE